MITLKRIPLIDGLSIEDAHKGGKAGTYSGDSTFQQVIGVMSGAYADPLDLTGMQARSQEKETQRLADVERTEGAELYERKRKEAVDIGSLKSKEDEEPKKITAEERDRRIEDISKSRIGFTKKFVTDEEDDYTGGF